MNKEDEARLLSNPGDHLFDAVIEASDGQSGDFFEEWHLADTPDRIIGKDIRHGRYRR